VKSWRLNEIDVAAQSPQVLDSTYEGRAIVIQLSAGDSLAEHQVHERGWLTVAAGRIEVIAPDCERIAGGPGLLVEFDPNERHAIVALEDSRLLLLLSPWPGEGHPGSPG